LRARHDHELRGFRDPHDLTAWLVSVRRAHSL